MGRGSNGRSAAEHHHSQDCLQPALPVSNTHGSLLGFQYRLQDDGHHRVSAGTKRSALQLYSERLARQVRLKIDRNVPDLSVPNARCSETGAAHPSGHRDYGVADVNTEAIEQPARNA